MPTRKLTMTVLEVYYAMREAGIRSSPQRIAKEIQAGKLPFGEVIFTGETGRNTYLIYKVDFLNWLKTKIPEEVTICVT